MASKLRIILAAAAVATLVGATGGIATLAGAAVWSSDTTPPPGRQNFRNSPT